MIPKHLIERGQYWTDSLTLVSGCSPVSEGCAHCWSAGMASRFPWGKGFAENGKWTGIVEPNYKALAKLEKRAASTRKLKPKVWQIWNDFFHPKHAGIYINMGLEGMRKCHQDTFLILTKHPDRIRLAFSMGYQTDWAAFYSNIYIGVSVESQKHIGRIDQLIQNWPGKKFVSIEPCLSAVDMIPEQLAELDQVIIGCESGAKRRQPKEGSTGIIFGMLRQCEDAGVPVFLKQWVGCSGELVKMPADVDGRTYDQLAWSKGD